MQLLPHTAHIWSIDLDIATDIEEQFLSILSADEHTRAIRFHQAVHKKRFIAARGALRHILATYLDIQPGDLIFNYNQHKKPSLISPDLPICFNITHSHDLALAAFTYDNEVGIDVQKIKTTYDINVAKRYFSAIEQQALTNQDSVEAFYRIWARKEALIKARGVGLLTDSPSSFSVSIQPIAETLHVFGQTWYLTPLQTDKHYQAAVVTKHPLDNIFYYDFKL